jgi:hypothetical protein
MIRKSHANLLETCKRFRESCSFTNLAFVNGRLAAKSNGSSVKQGTTKTKKI